MYRGNWHTREISGLYKQCNGNFKRMHLSFSPYSLLLMFGGSWLKVQCEIKFRELKTVDRKNVLLEKVFQNQHDMSQSCF